MSKQTAVEWLQEQFDNSDDDFITIEEFNQAKEMDKEQKIEAYRDGRTDQQSGSFSIFFNRSSELWYNENYNNDRTANTDQED